MTEISVSRRTILKTLLAFGFCPIDFLLNGLTNSFANMAQAQEKKGGLPRNYVLIFAPGGIAKWMFDNPLRPYKNEPFVEHPLICTKISAKGPDSSQMGFEYATSSIKGIEMPHLWNYEVPAPKGGMIPMENLLDHMMMIRGCRMGSDGHAINARKTFTPVPGGCSISGMVADSSTTPLPAVNLVGAGSISTSIGLGFKSPNGASLISVPRENRNKFEYLFRPFISSFNNPFKNGKEVELMVDEFLLAHQERAAKENGARSALFRDRANAKKLFKRNINDLSEVYEENVRKYQELVDRSLRATQVEGLTDRPIPGYVGLARVKKGDLLGSDFGLYANKEYFLGNGDLRGLFRQSEIPNLAEQFAITEFLLTQNLGSFVGINVDYLSNLFFENSLSEEFFERIPDGKNGMTFKAKSAGKAKLYTGTASKNIFLYDSHRSGTLATLLCCSMVYRAIASCLLELIGQLKKFTSNGSNLFDETLIQFSTEMGRDPRPDCSGSEHGWNGYSTSLYSGIFQGPQVIGNIYSTSKETGSYYQMNGTWGDAAPVAGLNGNFISIRNVASTISEILRVESLSPNNQPLFTVTGKQVKLSIERARNIGP